MDKSRRNTILARFLGAAAVVFLVYAAAGFFLVPPLLQRQLVALADQRLGQTLSIGKLKVNPFALSVEARELRLGQGSGTPLLAVRRVYLDLSLLGSGFGRGWVLSEAQTDGLQIQLEQQRDGHLNIAELARRWVQTSSPPKTQDKGSIRITLEHLLASDGALTYRKVAASGAPDETQVLPIRLELQNLSTLPDREGHYTVSARLADGGALTWRGDIALMPLQSEGDLSLEGLKLATVWKFIRDDVRLAEPQGTLSLATHYVFGYTNGKPDLGLSGLRMTTAGLRVVREGFAEPIVSLKTLEARDGSLQLARRTFVVPVIALGSGSVDVARNAEGMWNWAGFVRDQPPIAEAGKTQAAEAAQPWHVDLQAVNVDDVALHYEDRQRPAPLIVQTAALIGKAAITADTGGDTPGVIVRDIDLRLKDLRLPVADTSAVRLTELHIEKGHLDLAKHSLGAARLTVDGGALLIERGTDGAFPIAASLAGSNEPASPLAPMHPWRYAIDSVSVQGLDVALSDRSFGKQAVEYRFGGFAVSADGISNTGAKPIAFNATASIAGGGSISASGSASSDLSKIDAKVNVAAMALFPLQPFIARHVAVDLKSGSVSATATIAYRLADGKTSLTASGPVELAKVRLNEAGSDETVLAWEKLSAADARLSLGPDRVLIKEIIVQSPEAKIDISEQRELNLLQLFKHGSVPDKMRSPSRNDAKPSGFPVEIGEVRLRDGTVNFSDRSLALPFVTQVTNFTGTATTLGTNRERRATLQFEGDIGEFGSVQVDGQIESFAPKTFTEVHAAFENVDLPDLTPYSVTFLGRKIASGKLWLDLKYGIKNSQLIGDNEVTIRDLRLGEPVDSPTALKLPLDLAVALLTDSEGKIRTAVPVRGDLNNPKFAIGTVIREAIGNLIAKIVTAPFRALAGLFGGKHGKDDAGSVAFEPGSAKLRASENEKLQDVAKVLSDRPQLKLVVQAAYAPDTDRAAMKEEMASREVALAQGRSLEPGERPEPVVFDRLATQRALERLVGKKAADPAVVRNLAAQYAKRTGTQPRRAGMLMRETGDAEFYKSMYAWLVEAEQVSDDAMQTLAASRASAVLDKLRASGTDPKRLQSGPVTPGKQKNEKVVTAELMLELVGPKPFADSGEDSAMAQGRRKPGEL